MQNCSTQTVSQDWVLCCTTQGHCSYHTHHRANYWLLLIQFFHIVESLGTLRPATCVSVVPQISCPQPFTRVIRFCSSRIPIWKPYLHIYKSLFGVPLYALCLSVAIVTWQIFFIISSSRAPTKFQRIPPFLYNLLFHNHKTLALGKVWLFWFESLEYVFRKKYGQSWLKCAQCEILFEALKSARQCIKSCLTNLCESSAFFRISQGFAARWPNLCVSPEPQETPRNCILKSWTLLKTVQFWEVSY